MKRFFLLLITLSITSYGASHEHLKHVYDTHNQNFDAHNTYQEHHIPRGKYHLYAREFNPSLKKNSPTILLMHGFPDSLHLYDELIPYLHAYHVISFDFLGWGNSDKPKGYPYTSQSLYEDIDNIVKYFHLQNIVMVVHDASGPPGIDWAVAHPEKITKLVLLNTYYQPMERLIPPEAIARFSTPGIYRDISVWFSTHIDSAWINGFSTQITKFMQNSDKKEEYVKLLAYQSLQSRYAFFALNKVLRQEMKKRLSTFSHLQQFSKPVSIIFGKDDPYLNAHVAKTFQKMFPNTTLRLIKNAGHYVQIDNPKEVARNIAP